MDFHFEKRKFGICKYVQIKIEVVPYQSLEIEREKKGVRQREKEIKLLKTYSIIS